jgi:alpha-L-fucosidase
MLSTINLTSNSQYISHIDSAKEARLKLKWWTEARFGMFIHWGLYSLAAGEWNGEIMRGNGYAEQINSNMKIPNAEYDQLASKFNPVGFNAEEWVNYAISAGMKYIIITAKHQDGFAMFHSKASNYNVVDATLYKKDPLLELANAAHKAGLKFGFYYSNARDYHVAGANWNTHGNTWDFSKQTEDDFKNYYYGLVFDQVKELLTNYGKIDILWFDVPYKLTERMSSDLKEYVLSLQPECIINGRIGNNQGDYVSFGDNAIPDRSYESPWEACITMNDTWGYSKYDNNWKDSRQLLKLLIESVSKGGNLLLNVGPTGMGVFDKNATAILANIEAWMKLYHRSIYNCTSAPATFMIPDKCMLTYNSEAKRLFIHLIDSQISELQLKGYDGMVKKACLLDDTSEAIIANVPIRHVKRESDLVLILPKEIYKADLPVIELTLY